MKFFRKQKISSYLDHSLDDSKSKINEFELNDIGSKIEYQKAIEILDQRNYQLAKQVDHDGLSDMYFFNNKDKTFVTLENIRKYNDIFYYSIHLSFMAKPSVHLSSTKSMINDDLEDYIIDSVHGLFETYHHFSDRWDKDFELNITPDMFAKMKNCVPIINYIKSHDKIEIDDFYYLQEKYSSLIDNRFPDRLKNTINLLLMKYDKDITESNCDIYRLLNDDIYFKEKLLHESNFKNDIALIDIALYYIQVPDNIKDYVHELLGMQNKVVQFESALSEEETRNIISRLNYPKVEDLPITLPWINKDKDYEYQEESIKREDLVME